MTLTPTRRLALVAIVTLVLDQLTKFAVLRFLGYAQERVVIEGFFKFVHWGNTGAAFSMFANAGGWQRYFFIGIAIMASAWVVWLLRRYPQQKWFCLALGMILGGAIGNLIDRLRFDAVIDFLDFHVSGQHFPAFNVADSAISIGVFLMLIAEFRRGKAVSK